MRAAQWAAAASSDSTCYPRWTIVQGEYQGCSNTARIAPGNDTWINLLMLLHDRHGAVGPTRLEGYEWDPRRGDAVPGYEAYGARLGRLRTPFRIGLVQGGEWREPDGLPANPMFRGYVVFLVNPR